MSYSGEGRPRPRDRARISLGEDRDRGSPTQMSEENVREEPGGEKVT